MNLIDTHCHLTFEQFGGYRCRYCSEASHAGVTGWITVGTDLADSSKAVELASKFENMFAAVAIHPHRRKIG